MHLGPSQSRDIALQQSVFGSSVLLVLVTVILFSLFCTANRPINTITRPSRSIAESSMSFVSVLEYVSGDGGFDPIGARSRVMLLPFFPSLRAQALALSKRSASACVAECIDAIPRA